MFLPVHMPELCHWGLVIFSVAEQSVFFDDGYHCQISRDLRYRTKIILSMIHENTKLNLNSAIGKKFSDSRSQCQTNLKLAPAVVVWPLYVPYVTFALEMTTTSLGHIKIHHTCAPS